MYVQESLAFVYTDGGHLWLDEDAPLIDSGASTAVKAAEVQTARFTAAGGRGVALRFGHFDAPDSTQTAAMVKLARRKVSMNVCAPDLRHADAYEGFDQFASIGGIALSVVIAAAVLLSTRARPMRPAGSSIARRPAPALR